MRLRPNQTKIIGLLSVVFVMLLVTFAMKLPAANTSLEGTSWTLVSWDEQTTLIPPLANTKITAEFKSDTVSGSAGCNQYIATYQTDSNKLTINISGTSRKLCSETIMAQERQYLLTLQGTQSYKIDDQGQLQISYKTERDSGLMNFHPKQ